VSEQKQRLSLRSKRFTKYQSNPVGFIEDVLLGFVWSKQRQICESVRDNRFTAVPACHGPGKSNIAARLGSWWLSCHPPGEAMLVTTAPTFHQVKGILWREINKAHRIGGLPGWTTETQWKLPPNELIGFGRAAKDMTAFQGIHARYVLVIIDEATGVARGISEAAETLVTNEESRLLKIGNPDDPSTDFADSCKPGSGYNVIPISAFDTPNFTGEEIPEYLKHLLVSPTWVDERRRKWGESSPMWQSKVLGKFPDVSDDGLISLADISSAVAREYEPQPDDPIELGVDVARMGRDASVIMMRHGWKARTVKRLFKRDLMVLVGEVVQAIKDTGATSVKIDDTGMGGGVTDRLRELRVEGKIPAHVDIVAVNVGEGCRDMGQVERFRDLRMQLGWMMRDVFTNGLLDIDPDNEDLQAQASQIKYKVHSDGVMWLEKKADMKKRTAGMSPDDWDALVLAFTPKELGAMPVHDAVESDVVVVHFDPPKTWARVCSVHIDRGRFVAVWCAVDAEAKVNYIYAEYSAPLGNLAVHADAVKQRGSWIPVIFWPEADGRKKDAGIKLIDRLIELNVELYTADVDREAAIVEMTTQMAAQRLKVSERCPQWVAEYRTYRRDGEGEVVTGQDKLMQATELLLTAGVSVAAFESQQERISADDWARQTANPITGY
jgi:hypothetical protein